MFNVTKQQQQYETYLLSDEEADSRLEVVPERGGIITRWQIRDRDILYLDRERFADRSLSVRGGIPILFPICGNLPDNLYTYKDRQYNLKQHGFARDLPWQVTEEFTVNFAGITLVLKSNDYTRSVYPFDFQLAFTYQLQGNSLKIQQRFTNHSQEKMPFSSGLHPYFLVWDKSKLDFDIPASQYQDQRSKEIYPFSGKFDLDSEEIDAAFIDVSTNTTSIVDRALQSQLKITYSDFYSILVFWTLKGKDYVCLEPWSAPRNALNTGDYLTYLEPGSTYEAWVEMSVSFC
jgi:galactose mutarotase-like enzyme